MKNIILIALSIFYYLTEFWDNYNNSKMGRFLAITLPQWGEMFTCKHGFLEFKNNGYFLNNLKDHIICFCIFTDIVTINFDQWFNFFQFSYPNIPVLNCLNISIEIVMEKREFVHHRIFSTGLYIIISWSKTAYKIIFRSFILNSSPKAG